MEVWVSLWSSVDFVWTLLDFSMELTKLCVELAWRLCFGVEFVWILNFWFYSYFLGDFGIDCRMVLCRVFGMFCVVFVACFVASIRRIMWLMDKGCFGMVSGQKLACTEAAKELSGTPVRGSHAIAWLGSNLQPSDTQLHGFPRNCVALHTPRVRNCVGFHAIA